MQTTAIWEHALDHLRAKSPDPDSLLNTWRSERPELCSDQDLLREYGWVVASCGLTPQVVMKHWDRLGEAFHGWNPFAIAAQPDSVRIAALGVTRNARKIKAMIDFAEDLAREPGYMARLAAMPVGTVLAQLSTLPFVGANNRYHLARNLGWDAVVRTGPVVRFAEAMGTTAEGLCGEIAAETGERIRTVDLVLWYWAHQVSDEHLREMAWLFRG